MGPLRSQLDTWIWRSTLAAAAVGIVLTTVLGLRGAPCAPGVACISGAITGLLGAAGLRWLVVDIKPEFRHRVSMAIAVWSIGQLVTGIDVWSGTKSFSMVGSAISATAVPIAIYAIRAIPRTHIRHSDLQRLACEALMVATAALSAVWRYFLRPEDLTAPNLERIILLVVLGIELFVVAIITLRAVGTSDPTSVYAAQGLLLMWVGDMWLAAQPYENVATTLIWPTRLPVIAAVPFLVMAGRTITSKLLTNQQISSNELRRSLVLGGLVLGPLMFLVLDIYNRTYTDPVLALLIAILLMGFAGREVVTGKQTRALLEMLTFQALHDPLTGLGNRRALVDDLQVMTSGRMTGAVLALDLDHFKDVNTHGGHAMGDLVLMSVAEALRQACRGTENRPFRLGGDEFAVIVRSNWSTTLDIAEKLRHDVSDHVSRVKGLGQLTVTVSVGVAPMDSSVTDPLGPLTHATLALRQAKTQRNKVQVFNAELADESKWLSQVEHRLRKAVHRNEIEMNYQPVVHVRTGAIVGFEALARWSDSELGAISPAVFIPIAEQNGIITDLGAKALRDALAVIAPFHRRNIPLHVAVNVSPLQLKAASFSDYVLAQLEHYRVPPQALILEVTEGIFMDPDDVAVRTLHVLADHGVEVAIDDFGSGYSSLGYMSRLPAKVLKLDRSLVSQVQHKRTLSVVRGVVHMADSLGLRVIMEGIETQAVADTVTGFCDGFAQGWLWGKPIAPELISDLVTQMGARPELWLTTTESPWTARAERDSLASLPTQRPEMTSETPQRPRHG